MKKMILGLALSSITFSALAAENPYLPALYKAINKVADQRFEDEAYEYEETGSGCRYYSRGAIQEFAEIAPRIFKVVLPYTCRDEDGVVTNERTEEYFFICSEDATACQLHR